MRREREPQPVRLGMDLKLFATVFVTVFVAELGDKTQLATMLYASNAAHPKLTVFAASAAAQVLTSALGVLAGTLPRKATRLCHRGHSDAFSDPESLGEPRANGPADGEPGNDGPL